MLLPQNNNNKNCSSSVATVIFIDSTNKNQHYSSLHASQVTQLITKEKTVKTFTVVVDLKYHWGTFA